MAKQFDELTSETIDGTKYEFEKYSHLKNLSRFLRFAAGDYKMLMILYGLCGGGANYFCVQCEAHKDSIANYGLFKSTQKARARNGLDDLKVSGCKNKDREALFKTIPSKNYVIPMLHIWLTVAVDVFNIIQKEVIKKDMKKLPGKD